MSYTDNLSLIAIITASLKKLKVTKVLGCNYTVTCEIGDFAYLTATRPDSFPDLSQQGITEYVCRLDLKLQ